MTEVSRDRRHVAVPFARGLALALTTCVLASCSTEEPHDRDAARDRAASASLSPSASATARQPAASQPAPRAREGLPTAPARHDAAALAGQIDLAWQTLRDPDATAAEVRRAGEFQQLAVLRLATAAPEFRRSVTTGLDPRAAATTRGAVAAARSLRGLAEPQRSWPRWRIVNPPPPAELLGYYREAQRRTGVPWTYLAAIHLVETRMGRIRGVSTAGAVGPMQFLPSTWQMYGAGGDIRDPRDAVLAAARLLSANGAPGDMAEALWHYNPSDHYVRAVSAYAHTMQRSATTYRGYWHWRVLYRHVKGTYVLPVGYPDEPAVLVSRD